MRCSFLQVVVLGVSLLGGGEHTRGLDWLLGPVDGVAKVSAGRSEDIGKALVTCNVRFLQKISEKM